jgi:hypothetical protein
LSMDTWSSEQVDVSLIALSREVKVWN